VARIGNLIRDPEELKRRATELNKLTTMFERVTKNDVAGAAQALLDSAEDIAYLLSGKHKPVGCPCRLIENDDNGTCYLIYEDACFHHKHLKAREEQLKAAYEKAEKALEDKLRVSFFESALQGLLASGADAATPEVLADRAIAVADAAIARLRK